MKYAIFGDIHANLEAFEAVLSALDSENADEYFCIGDIIDYGASPNECVDRIRAFKVKTVCGNHDAAVCGNMDASFFNDNAKVSVNWTRESLTSANYNFLLELPYTYEREDFILVHGTLDDPPAFKYLINKDSSIASFKVLKHKLCFVGHSHIPAFFYSIKSNILKSSDTVLDIEDKGKCIVNVGSVGQPRDNDNRAAYCIYDSGIGRVEIKRLEYDYKKAARKILDCGLPDFLASRLYSGK